MMQTLFYAISGITGIKLNPKPADGCVHLQTKQGIVNRIKTLSTDDAAAVLRRYGAGALTEVDKYDQ
jgi:hypothetical protein